MGVGWVRHARTTSAHVPGRRACNSSARWFMKKKAGRESAAYVLCAINKCELRCFVHRRERLQCRTCVPNTQCKSRTCRPKSRTRNGSAVVLLCRRCCLVLRATLRCAARTAEHRAELLYNIVWILYLARIKILLCAHDAQRSVFTQIATLLIHFVVPYFCRGVPRGETLLTLKYEI